MGWLGGTWAGGVPGGPSPMGGTPHQGSVWGKGQQRQSVMVWLNPPPSSCVLLGGEEMIGPGEEEGWGKIVLVLSLFLTLLICF